MMAFLKNISAEIILYLQWMQRIRCWNAPEILTTCNQPNSHQSGKKFFFPLSRAEVGGDLFHLLTLVCVEGATLVAVAATDTGPRLDGQLAVVACRHIVPNLS